MHSNSSDMSAPMLKKSVNTFKQSDIVITFEPNNMGLTYQGHYVTSVCGQAAKFGIKIGWVISGVNNEPMPDNTAIIKECISQTRDKNDLTQITFIPVFDSDMKDEKVLWDHIEKHGRDLKFPGLDKNPNLLPKNKHVEYDPISIFMSKSSTRDPIFTYLVICACIAVFILEMYCNDWVFEPILTNPMIGPNTRTLQKLGAKNKANSLEIIHLVVPMWLHAGIIHLGLNLFAFYKTSKELEIAFGFYSVAIIYMVSGIFSAIASAIFLPWGLTIGASGAIFGLYGACWADFVHNFAEIDEKGKYFIGLVFGTIVSLGMGLLPWLDNFYHIGGFVSGILCGIFFCIKPNYGHTWTRYFQTYQIDFCIKIFGLCTIGVMFMCALYILDTMHGSWCSFCNYLSCIPTPWWSCNICPYMIYSNGTMVITCPNTGIKYWLNTGDVGQNCQDRCF